MKLILQKIDKAEFERLCNLTYTEFINGTCFEIDSGNLVAFEYFYDDWQHDYFKVLLTNLAEDKHENIKE